MRRAGSVTRCRAAATTTKLTAWTMLMRGRSPGCVSSSPTKKSAMTARTRRSPSRTRSRKSRSTPSPRSDEPACWVASHDSDRDTLSLLAATIPAYGERCQRCALPGTRLGRTVIESTAPSLVVTYASSAAFAAPRSAFIWDMGLRCRRSTATAARAPIASFYGHRNRPLRCLQAAGAKVAIWSASAFLKAELRLDHGRGASDALSRPVAPDRADVVSQASRPAVRRRSSSPASSSSSGCSLPGDDRRSRGGALLDRRDELAISPGSPDRSGYSLFVRSSPSAGASTSPPPFP